MKGCVRCFIAVRANRRRSRSSSIRRSIRCACAVIAVEARRYISCASHAATREVILTMPPRASLREAQRVRAEAWRLDRARGCTSPAGIRALHPRRGHSVSRRASSHRASDRRARHGVDLETSETGERLIGVAGVARACRPPRHRLPASRGRRYRELRPVSEPQRGAAAWRRASSASRCTRPVEPLGLSARPPACCRFSWRLILAPEPCCFDLSRHPRGRAPCRRDRTTRRASGGGW